MEFKDYQHKSSFFTKQGTNERDLMSVFICGLVGEAGSVASCYKKSIRDGKYQSYMDEMKEEMGDVLWYLSALSTSLGINLNDIAVSNLSKIEGLGWCPDRQHKAYKRYDVTFPKNEQFPDKYSVKFEEVDNRVNIIWLDEDKNLGSGLTDANAIEDDYRFHDIFHMSYSAYLGWSPLLRGRGFLDCKRKSNSQTDQNEDGGRAWIIEEAISALVFNYAKKVEYFKETENIDNNLLKTIKSLVDGYEVSSRSPFQWKEAIIKGYEIFRNLKDNRGGVVTADLVNRKLSYKRT